MKRREEVEEEKVPLEEMEKIKAILDMYLELENITRDEHRRAVRALNVGWEYMNTGDVCS